MVNAISNSTGGVVSTPDTQPSNTLFIGAADAEAALDWRSTIQILREAYSLSIAPSMCPPRSIARGDGVWLRSLTAISPLGGHLGCKLIAMNTNSRRVSYLIALFDPATMHLAVLLDGNHITGARTAATSALAADLLARRGDLRLAVLGSGYEARGHVAALSAIRKIESMRIFSPTKARREGFAADVRAELGIEVTACESPQEAVQGADLVICAARSKDESPILHGEWLEPGVTVISIGSTVPEQREIDTEVIRKATLIVADVPAEVQHNTGDMLACAQEGIPFEHKLSDLGDLVAGRCPGRREDSDIVVYKSVGSALQDIVVAEQVASRGIALGLGVRLPAGIIPVVKS